MRRTVSNLFVVLLGLAIGAWPPATVVAQERTGSISGTVTDAGHYVLPAARIDLEPKGPSAVTDEHGRFAITSVPPGNYTVTVSYVGLSPYTATINPCPPVRGSYHDPVSPG